MKHPPLQTLFLADAIGPMAIARRDGCVRWAQRYGSHTGILLFDRVDAAAAWLSQREGYPFVVAEFGRGCVDLDLLERVRDLEFDFDQPYRAWVYPEEIWFGDVRWHKYEQVPETLGVTRSDHEITMNIIATNRREPEPLPTGTISIDI